MENIKDVNPFDKSSLLQKISTKKISIITFSLLSIFGLSTYIGLNNNKLITYFNNSFASSIKDTVIDKKITWIGDPEQPGLKEPLAGGTTVTDDNHIYIIGGYSKKYSSKPLSTVQIGKQIDDKIIWKTSKNHLPMPLKNSMSILNGNKIYVMGGLIGNGSENISDRVYIGTIDNEEITWKESANKLPTKLVRAGAVIKDNRIYVSGGVNNFDNLAGILNTTYIGQISEDDITWSVSKNFLIDHISSPIPMLVDNNIFLIGGETNKREEDGYIWAQKGKIDSKGEVTWSISSHLLENNLQNWDTVATLVNNKVFLITSTYKVQVGTYKNNDITSWKNIDSRVLTNVTEPSIAILKKNIYVTGGNFLGTTNSKIMQKGTITNDTVNWKNDYGTEKDQAIATTGSSTISYGNNIFVIGGFNQNGEYIRKVQIGTFSDNKLSWSLSKTLLPEALSFSTPVLIGNKAILFGGLESFDGAPWPVNTIKIGKIENGDIKSWNKYDNFPEDFVTNTFSVTSNGDTAYMIFRDKVYSFKFEGDKLTWKLLSTTPPHAVEGGISKIIDNKIYLFNADESGTSNKLKTQVGQISDSDIIEWKEIDDDFPYGLRKANLIYNNGTLYLFNTENFDFDRDPYIYKANIGDSIDWIKTKNQIPITAYPEQNTLNSDYFFLIGKNLKSIGNSNTVYYSKISNFSF